MTTAHLTSLLLVAALAAVMISMGLKVRLEEVMASFRNTRVMLLGLLANFVLVPVATVALLYGFHADGMVAAGFLILAVCPGAPLGPPFTSIAGGDLSCSIGLMVLLSGLSAILSPLLLAGLLTALSQGRELQINYLMILKTLWLAQLLPLSIGLTVHHWRPVLAQWLARPVGLVANLLLVLGAGFIIATQYEMLSAIRWRGWAGMFLLLAASLVIGWLCGGRTRETRIALALTTAVRNAAVGLVIASASFAATPAVTAVVAYALVSMFGAMACALAMRRWTASGRAVLMTAIPGG